MCFEAIAEIAPGLNKDLSKNFYWLRRTNHVKSTEECVILTEKYVLVKTIFIIIIMMSRW